MGNEIVFWVLALSMTLSALGVVVSRSAIYSALSLIANLLMVAVAYAFMGAHFLAAVQVLVYAGAIMVLVLFVVMLLNLKEELRLSSDKWLWILGLIASAVFSLAGVALISESFAGREVKQLSGTVALVGRSLFTDYVLLVQSAGMLLMAALVGAVMLAKKRRAER
jgi:NADH-quinone oxidoreductase subunit J